MMSSPVMMVSPDGAMILTGMGGLALLMIYPPKIKTPNVRVRIKRKIALSFGFVITSYLS